VGVAIAFAACGLASAADLTPRPTMDVALKPFVESYCSDCHSGDNPEAGLRLDQLLKAPSVPHHRHEWTHVLERLEKKEMPPEEGDQPDDAKRAEIVAWLKAELADPDCSLPQDPGRVTLHRLNRTEYQNTIRNLLGVEFHAASVLPRDELGFGFDNNGDVLSLPPVLLEKYLQAAEAISAQAIVTPESILEPAQVFTWGKLHGGDAAGKGVRGLLTNGRVWADVHLEKPGRYVARVRAFATQAGDEPVKMRLFAGEKELRTANVEAEQHDPQTYVASFNAEAGDLEIGVDFLNDAWEPWSKDPERTDRNLYVMSITIVGPVSELDDGHLPESHSRLLTWRPSPEEWYLGSKWRTPLRDVIENFLARAYRRPPTTLEIERLSRLAAASHGRGDSYERTMQLVLQAALVSPEFLFRGETNSERTKGVRNLNEYELASRLSYFLWSSMPDDELLKLARDGQLAEQLDGQVDRMLASPKSDQLIRNFGEQWLETRRLENMQRDNHLFPHFDGQLRTAFREETYRLLQDIVRNNRPLTTLVSADYSFVNGRLAEHYGLSGPKGDEFVRVELPKERRIGILGHAGVLSVTAYDDRTSPVLRGKWVLDHLLDDPPAPPPPGVTNLPPAEGKLEGKSLRERLEVHRANPSCAVCHNRMDPLGLALENFDAVGRWREKDGADKINTAGQLPDGRHIVGPEGLRDLLLADFPKIRRCIAEKLLTYALGRGLEPSDDCAVNEIVAGAQTHGDTFAGMVHAIVKSTPFLRCHEE
jgi:mono/diheme cytochrome c family protein